MEAEKEIADVCNEVTDDIANINEKAWLLPALNITVRKYLPSYSKEVIKMNVDNWFHNLEKETG